MISANQIASSSRPIGSSSTMMQHHSFSPKKPSIRLTPLNTAPAPQSRHMSLPPLSLSLSSSSGGPRSAINMSLSIPRSPATAGPSTSHNAQYLAAAACASEILPRIWISDLASAENGPLLASLGITHIISAMRDVVAVPSSFTRRNGKQMQLPLDDLPFAELAGHLPRATAFMHLALDADPRAKVLVHCAQGISRSVAVVCAYLMESFGWTPGEALRFVKSKRRVANPNAGFCAQLNEYAESLRTKGGR